MSGESPEQLLDAFRAAALSVTKLYKTSAAAQTKSRVDGYQDCLEDLLVFLDKEGLGLGEGDGAKIRKWAADKMEGRDIISQGLDSDDDAEKNEPVSSPEIHRSNSSTQLRSSLPTSRNEVNMRDSAPAAPLPNTSTPSVQQADVAPESTEIIVPTQEVFTFTSSHPYPTDTYMNLANLDLSDSRAHDAAARSTNAFSRNARQRNTSRSGPRAMLGRGAGQKRKVNLADIFDLGSLGQGDGRDVFGSGGKRSRHV